jgi:hypothetical protein
MIAIPAFTCPVDNAKIVSLKEIEEKNFNELKYIDFIIFKL